MIIFFGHFLLLQQRKKLNKYLYLIVIIGEKPIYLFFAPEG